MAGRQKNTFVFRLHWYWNRTPTSPWRHYHAETLCQQRQPPASWATAEIRNIQCINRWLEWLLDVSSKENIFIFSVFRSPTKQIFGKQFLSIRIWNMIFCVLRHGKNQDGGLLSENLLEVLKIIFTSTTSERTTGSLTHTMIWPVLLLIKFIQALRSEKS